MNSISVVRYRNSLVVSNSSSEESRSKSLSTNFFDLALRESAKLRVTNQRKFALGFFSRSNSFNKYRVTAGLSSNITEGGFCEARIKLALFSMLVAGALGFVLSQELGFMLSLLGAIYGYLVPSRWLAHETLVRTSELECHLPEMLDVLSICMRSGLSFDRSLDIYVNSFNSFLSRELSYAKTLWTSGLKTREGALRDVARSYSSIIFDRCIETIIRSLRLGSSMNEELRSAAKEARVAYRTKREEEVAKAPVKMMIPTGTLILPAMLFLVLGPVLLELASGAI